jgi:hypothetical protein
MKVAILEDCEVSEACCAFWIISFCLISSLARIGTRSLGTGVRSLKF